MKRIPSDTRQRIIAQALEGLSTRQIAASFNIHHSTVAAIIKEHGQPVTAPSSGRPKRLTDREERRIIQKVSSGEWRSAVQAQRHLSSEYLLQLSASSIKRVLRRHGLNGRVRHKKPLLRKKHRQRRYAFALQYRKWKVEQWKHVVWSDESKFNIFGSDGRQYCWRRVNERLRDHHVNPTVKHGGGSIMVWGCITWWGVGYLCKIDNGLDAQLYQNILGDELLSTLGWYGMDKGSIIFQHDNDPKHTAKSTKEWLDDHGINVLSWPAQSPDLNPIEHVWNEVDRRLRNHPTKPTSKESLWELLQEIWEGIEPEFCQKLIMTMPKRLQDVRSAKGGYTFW
jgi:transposase